MKPIEIGSGGRRDLEVAYDVLRKQVIDRTVEVHRCISQLTQTLDQLTQRCKQERHDRTLAMAVIDTQLWISVCYQRVTLLQVALEQELQEQAGE